jgi:hypothetical protein
MSFDLHGKTGNIMRWHGVKSPALPLDRGPSGPSGPAEASAPVAPVRLATRRAALPSGRAVVGGFLVAVAGVGVFTAAGSSDDGPRDAAVVVRHDVRAGTVLAAADLDVVAVDLPEDVRAGLADDVGDLAGTVTLHDLRADALVRRSDTVAAPDRPGSEEVSFAVPAARALGRSFRPGELVDVLATYEGGAGACTDRIVRQAPVADFRVGDGDLGSRDDVVFVVSVDDPDTARLLTFAADTASLSVVGTTTASARAPVRQCPQSWAALGPATSGPSGAAPGATGGAGS